MADGEAGDEISGPMCWISQQIRHLEHKKALAAVPQELKVFSYEVDV